MLERSYTGLFLGIASAGMIEKNIEFLQFFQSNMLHTAHFHVKLFLITLQSQNVLNLQLRSKSFDALFVTRFTNKKNVKRLLGLPMIKKIIINLFFIKPLNSQRFEPSGFHQKGKKSVSI